MKDSWDKVSRSLLWELQVPRGRWNAKMRRSLFHITFFCGEKESQGIGDTSFLFGLMLSSEVHKQRGERTALQADRLHAAVGKSVI